MHKKIHSDKINPKDLLKHETKNHILRKFLLILSIFLIYMFFIAKKYGIQQGFLTAVLTWSFFVLCTPIADAGFLIDFPMRLITNFKMLILEGFVWIIAIALNLYAFLFNPNIYEKTKLLQLFKHILGDPFPFWGIIFISMIGTFISIKFGDELLDETQHKERKLYQKHKNHYHLIIMIFLFLIAFIFYNFSLKSLGIELPI